MFHFQFQSDATSDISAYIQKEHVHLLNRIIGNGFIQES